MKKAYYREQALERIARDVIIAYDPRLYYGSPAAIPIEDIIEAQGLVLEYQYLRNNGRVLGETIFDDGLTAIYDWENHRYDLLPVKGGTILIDCSLCEEEASTGRLRFTCAHELGHSVLHPNANTPFFKAHTLFSVSKMETEANRFMICLTISDDELMEYAEFPMSHLANIYDVPMDLIRWRYEQMAPLNGKEHRL